MTLTDALFNDGIALESITSRSLCGGTLSPIIRYGDVQNKISIGTASAHIAKNYFKESSPYYREYDAEGNLEVIPTWHFLVELRRQLSGCGAEGTSTFSPEEKVFYEEFQEWQMGVTKYGELLIALEYLDDWLVDEITGTAHPELNRDYSESHPWYKILEREED